MLAIPEATVSVGGTAVATENLLELHIHLGCTREVSSLEVVVDNSNPDYHEADYSPGGDKEFTKGDEVIIKCTRGTISGSTKALLTGTLESLEYIDQAEDYQYKDVVILRGRCKGWQLFARKFDGDLITLVGTGYQAYKRASGEAESMVAYLIDNYTETPLVHSRVNDPIAQNTDYGSYPKTLVVTDGTKFTANDLIKIKEGSNWEYNQVASISTHTLTLTSDMVRDYTTSGTVYLDLIRESDTTYTKMLFSHETVFDIIKFISDTADTSGTIGYDSRVEYDGKYAWLPRGLVTESNFDLTAEVQLERFSDDATRIKNKITVFGKADKPYPLDADGQAYSDGWTDLSQVSVKRPLQANAASGQAHVEIAAGGDTGLANGDYVWLISESTNGELCQIKDMTANGNVDVEMESNLTYTYNTADEAILFLVYDASASQEELWCYVPINDDTHHVITSDLTIKHTGTRSVEMTISNESLAKPFLLRKDGMDMDTYSNLSFMMYFVTTKPTLIIVLLRSGSCTGNDAAWKVMQVPSSADRWVEFKMPAGTNNEGGWTMSGLDWTDVKWIQVTVGYAAANSPVFHIDRLYCYGKRWGGGTDNAAVDGFAEDSTSQSTYGTKEHVAISDMLLSDKECESKAQGLLAFYMNPRTTYELESETLDWGDYPIYVGDKIAVDLTPLGISGDKRVDSIDIHLTSADHKLIASFTIEDTPPRRADYIYDLSKRLRQLERNYRDVR